MPTNEWPILDWIDFGCRSIAADARAIHAHMTAKDLQRLRAVTVLGDPTNEAWQLLDDPELGHTAFRILTVLAFGPET